MDPRLHITKNTLVRNQEQTDADVKETVKDLDSLINRVIPILLFCQANKGDLSLYESWKDRDDAGKKLFYAYYAGVFCRILYIIETSSLLSGLVNDCNLLLEKYNWYDIQEEDLRRFHSDGPYACEVPDALQFLDGIDNVAWEKSGFKNGRDAVCLKLAHGSWTFADVRGIKNDQC